MTKHRSHSAAFKRQVAEEFLSRRDAARVVEGARHLPPADPHLGWQFEAGALDDDVQAADLLQEYEAKIAALERMVGRQALEIELLEGALKADKRDYLRRYRPREVSVSQGCELMGLSRSIFYDMPSAALKAAELLAPYGTICDEFEWYGYRRVGAALRHQGIVVNNKRLRRLMREHGLQPKRRRRYVVTTDSSHAGPIFRDLAKDVVADRPNQLWVADLTYVSIPGGFVYLAAILDAWSRKVVGYAISRSMDARIAVAALKAAVRSRNPPAGCIHHSDRGSQLEFSRSSQRLSGPTEDARQTPRQVSSSQGSCAAWC